MRELQHKGTSEGHMRDRSERIGSRESGVDLAPSSFRSPRAVLLMEEKRTRRKRHARDKKRPRPQGDVPSLSTK